jgi:sigma54-dependent transcription regulator
VTQLPLPSTSLSSSHRTTRNDADGLRKYLARFALDFESIRRAMP